MKPNICVLITCFNEEKFIAKCLQSVINQSLSPSRIIIVDNASVDTTFEICKDFQNSGIDITLRRNSINIGALKSFLYGVELVREDYVLYLGAHDYIHPNYLEMCYNTMINNSQTGLVYSQNYRVDEYDEITRHMDGGNFNSEFIGIDALINSLNRGVHECTAVNGFYRSEYLRSSTFSTVFSPDILLLFKLMTISYIKKIDLPIYYRREFSTRNTSYLQRITGKSGSEHRMLSALRKKIVFGVNACFIFFKSPQDSFLMKISKFPLFINAFKNSFKLLSFGWLRTFL